MDLEVMHRFAAAVAAFRKWAAAEMSPCNLEEVVDDMEGVLLLYTQRRRRRSLFTKREFKHKGVLLKRMEDGRSWSAPLPVSVANAPWKRLGRGHVCMAFLEQELMEQFERKQCFFVDPSKKGQLKAFTEVGARAYLNGCVIEYDLRGHCFRTNQTDILPSVSVGDAIDLEPQSKKGTNMLTRQLRKELDELVSSTHQINAF